MEYKITCICGHQFLVSDDQLRQSRGEVSCPSCHQRLNPAIEARSTPVPPDGPLAIPAADSPPDAAEPTKRCPFCGEVILAIARKCKHCGEFLDRAAPPPAPHDPSHPAPGVSSLTPNAPHASAATAASANDPVFSLYRSQWDNFWKFLTLGALVFFVAFILWFFEALHPYFFLGSLASLVFALFAGWFFYITAKTTHILIRPLRIDVEKGILTKNLSSLELFRISDVDLQQGLIPRLLGFGTIKLTTTDADSPEMVLYQIPRAREVRAYLQTQIPLAARQRGAVYMEK